LVQALLEAARRSEAEEQMPETHGRVDLLLVARAKSKGAEAGKHTRACQIPGGGNPAVALEIGGIELHLPTPQNEDPLQTVVLQLQSLFSCRGRELGGEIGPRAAFHDVTAARGDGRLSLEVEIEHEAAKSSLGNRPGLVIGETFRLYQEDPGLLDAGGVRHGFRRRSLLQAGRSGALQIVAIARELWMSRLDHCFEGDAE